VRRVMRRTSTLSKNPSPLGGEGQKWRQRINTYLKKALEEQT
jgi:hypothetical protein